MRISQNHVSKDWTWRWILAVLAVTCMGTPLSALAGPVPSFQGLGDLPGGIFSSFAAGVSADGSVVVGSSISASGTEAFRWTVSGMFGMGDLPGGVILSQGFGVSADGSVVVGSSQSAFGLEAFRWTDGGMVGLGDLPGGGGELHKFSQRRLG